VSLIEPLEFADEDAYQQDQRRLETAREMKPYLERWRGMPAHPRSRCIGDRYSPLTAEQMRRHQQPSTVYPERICGKPFAIHFYKRGV
jgi:hypothetical protein